MDVTTTVEQLVQAEFFLSPFVISSTETPRKDRVLTVHVFLVSLQSLDDASVSFQAALPQLVQVIHHVVVRLQRPRESTR